MVPSGFEQRGGVGKLVPGKLYLVAVGAPVAAASRSSSPAARGRSSARPRSSSRTWRPRRP
jgi:hypothetical protein